MDINTLSWKDNTLRVNYLSGKTLEVSPVSFFEYMYLSDIHSSNDVEFLNTFFKKRTCKIVQYLLICCRNVLCPVECSYNTFGQQLLSCLTAADKPSIVLVFEKVALFTVEQPFLLQRICYSSVSILDGHIIKLSEVILYQNVLIRDFVPHKIRIL